MFKTFEKEKPYIIGLCQALGVTIYCGLIALFFNFMSKSSLPEPPGFFGFFMMLVIFVSSAAITGTLVFGYPAYLVLVKNKIAEALSILAFTILFSLAIILITMILIFTLLV